MVRSKGEWTDYPLALDLILEDFVTPIDHLIDQNVRCLRCGAPRAARCDCMLTVRCPTCQTTIQAVRDPSQDPVGTVEIVACCLSCMSTSDPRYTITYLDADGDVIDVL
jgi:hypothetical protein